MVDKWNKNELKAKILKFLYMYLFTFQVILLWLQYSFNATAKFSDDALHNFSRNWFDDPLDLLLGTW